MYKGQTSAQDIVKRFVTLRRAPLRLLAYLPLLSVEELAKKKGVKMAQIAVAWSLKRVTAPIIGSTKIANMKEVIGKRNVTQHFSPGVLTRTTEAIDIELTEEEAKYLEEPYKPGPVLH
jgi:hypothetical protein